MEPTRAEIRKFKDECAAQISAVSKRSKAQQARVHATRSRLVAHFDRIDAHLARTH